MYYIGKLTPAAFNRPLHPHGVSLTTYRNVHGVLLWSSRASQQPVRKVGDLLSHDRIRLRVVGVARGSSEQHVNVELAEAPLPKRRRRSPRAGQGNDALLTVRVPEAMLDGLERIADLGNEPVSAVARRLLAHGMEQEGMLPLLPGAKDD